MDWIELTVHGSEQAREAIANILMEAGAGGVLLAAPDVFTAYYPEDGEVEALCRRIRQRVEGLARFDLDPGPARVVWRRVREEDWAHAWKEYFYPTRVGRSVVVRPTWRRYEPRPGDLVVDLDPGMAFGTGSHATTALCIEALEAKVQAGARVFDVGTGSGILAIVAAKLGASEVVGCDVDPVAVEAARANVSGNGVDERVRLFLGSWLALREWGRADLVVANIVADVIEAMAPDVRELVEPGGWFVASGIASGREEGVCGRLRSTGWNVQQVVRRGEWACVTASPAGGEGG